jgi:hypothetical protein
LPPTSSLLSLTTGVIISIIFSLICSIFVSVLNGYVTVRTDLDSFLSCPSFYRSDHRFLSGDSAVVFRTDFRRCEGEVGVVGHGDDGEDDVVVTYEDDGWRGHWWWTVADCDEEERRERTMLLVV